MVRYHRSMHTEATSLQTASANLQIISGLQMRLPVHAETCQLEELLASAEVQ